jgi:hypothetical protein
VATRASSFSSSTCGTTPREASGCDARSRWENRARLEPRLGSPSPRLSRSFASTSIETLARRLAEDPDWEIRVEAAYGLARSEAGEAIPPLEAAQADVSEFVRAEAASGIAALHKLGLEAPPPEEPGGKDAKPEGGSGSGV